MEIISILKENGEHCLLTNSKESIYLNLPMGVIGFSYELYNSEFDLFKYNFDLFSVVEIYYTNIKVAEDVRVKIGYIEENGEIQEETYFKINSISDLGMDTIYLDVNIDRNHSLSLKDANLKYKKLHSNGSENTPYEVEVLIIFCIEWTPKAKANLKNIRTNGDIHIAYLNDEDMSNIPRIIKGNLKLIYCKIKDKTNPPKVDGEITWI